MPTNIVNVVMTNGLDLVAISNQVASVISNLSPQTTNWTSVWQTFFGIAAIAFPAMIAAIKIFASKQTIKDELLRESLYLQEMKNNSQRLSTNFEDYQRDNNISIQALREQFTAIRIEFTEISTQHENNTRTVEEIKKDYRDLIRRLDELLKQFSDYIGSESY